MQASVRFRLPDGSSELLVPGDIIGRTWSAALKLDDPHVSEAHAMLTLRGEELLLLALRRRIYVDGKAMDTVELRPGMHIRFAPAVELVVEELLLPETVLGIEGDGLVRQVLPGTASLVLSPHPRLVAGVVADALCTLWHSGTGWRGQIGQQPPIDLEPGTPLKVAGLSFRTVEVPLSHAGQMQTRADSLSGPLRIVAQFDTVHLYKNEGAPLILNGQNARVISELVSIGAPVAWSELASPLWPDIDDRLTLRRRWDVLLVRLRARLRDGGIRPDLIQATHVGLITLVLQQGDVVEDRS